MTEEKIKKAIEYAADKNQQVKRVTGGQGIIVSIENQVDRFLISGSDQWGRFYSFISFPTEKEAKECLKRFKKKLAN